MPISSFCEYIFIVNIGRKINKINLDETKVIYWSKGSDQPYFKQMQKKNFKILGFSSIFAMQNIIFEKIQTLRIKQYFFLPTNRPSFFGCHALRRKNYLVLSLEGKTQAVNG